ncbi:hypothetical protein F0Q45_02455 [Mycobacterium simiae]|uniref:ESX-1 secretion-associated protein EspH n=1 Tax=Mycobacterium simiae TaxID=1784 RepID=A0A5B1BX44_MYCSI|nr:hypothetical protein [Mycobacterium simiae]KAA1251749.1 hypothetical protein F0Q45_02455 [Mycobacterium simiae]
MPQHEEHDDLAALDFYDDGEARFDNHSDAALDATDLDGIDDSAAGSADDAFEVFEPAEAENIETEVNGLDSQAETPGEEDKHDEDAVGLFTVVNPPETVSVSALIDGRTQRVDLWAEATRMSESELADEIVVLAGLARKKGLAGQHTYLLQDAFLSDDMRDMGLDVGEVLRDFMQNGMGLSTPEQAAAAQAEVFAARYTTDR